MSSNSSVRGMEIGVDVGGTFTDIFHIDRASGAVGIAKTSSTPANQAQGFMTGLFEATDDLSTVATIVHGTTVATNALLERNGARTGLITTTGFRDVLEMRRRDRPQTWGLRGSFEPVVPRDLRLEADERTHADGTVVRAVDRDEVRSAVRGLRQAGCEAIAIVFINAYANPSNERAAREAALAEWPEAIISVSSDILPEIREFERTSTTALNAYLQPVIGRYLDKLEADLGKNRFDGQFLVVQSNGGLMTPATARSIPVRTALSGPAAGVIAAAQIGEAAGFRNIITCDMGGTSFDVSTIADGRHALTQQITVDFGLEIRSPMIEIVTIGAGGGSIAHVDAGGLLQIGPESAGADPGPAAYGKGGSRPTVTDANIVLGRINADSPIGGGDGRLDVEKARMAISEHVAVPLSIGVDDAAEAVITVANARMSGAIRIVSIERGLDPREFAVMPFGGGGALHACAFIREIGLAKAVIPRYPGVASALGCVVADMRHDFIQTLNQNLDELDASSISALAGNLVAQGRDLLSDSGVAFSRLVRHVEFDMHYVGQTHTIAARLDDAPADQAVELTQSAIRSAFDSAYRHAYGRLLEGVSVRVLNLRVAVTGVRPAFDFSLFRSDSSATIDEARTGRRDVRFDGVVRPTDIYARHRLPEGARLKGPAILEQADTTILVEPGMSAEIDAFGNVVVAPD